MKKLLLLLFLAMAVNVSAKELEIPKDVSICVKKNAARMFPDDYVTRDFYINKQFESYRIACNFPWKVKVSKAVSNKIFDKAYEMFGVRDDYITMLDQLNKQLKAYLKLK